MHTSYSFHVSEGHIVALIWKHGGECIRFAIVTRKLIAYHMGNQLYFLRQPGGGRARFLPRLVLAIQKAEIMLAFR